MPLVNANGRDLERNQETKMRGSKRDMHGENSWDEEQTDSPRTEGGL